MKAAALLGPERVGGEMEVQSSGSRVTSNLPLPAAAADGILQTPSPMNHCVISLHSPLLPGVFTCFFLNIQAEGVNNYH